MIVYIPACVALIAIVLMQKGKGVGFAGAFGMGGGSEAVFGPRTARSLPQKLTYTAGGIFMIVALILSSVSGKVGRGIAPAPVGPDSVAASTALDDFFADELPEDIEVSPETISPDAVVEPLDESLEDEFPEVPVSPLEIPMEPETSEEDSNDVSVELDELPTGIDLEAPSFGEVDIEIIPGDS